MKFQGGEKQSPHKYKLAHKEWAKVGRPATMTRLALKGITPASIGGPIDLTMDKVLTNGHIYEVRVVSRSIASHWGPIRFQPTGG